MASFNRVILIGNLTQDPELRYLQNQTAVTEVGIAVNDKRKNAQGEWIEETTFVDVTFWARTAEVVCEYLKKGASLLVEGHLKLHKWETDGQKRSKLRVVCDRMVMLGGKPGGAGGGGGGASRSASNTGGNSGPSYDESEYSQPSHDQYDSPPPAARASAAAAPAPQDDIPF